MNMKEERRKEFDSMCTVYAERPLFFEVSPTKIERFIDEVVIEEKKELLEEISLKFSEICNSHDGNPTGLQVAASIAILLNDLKARISENT